MSAGARTRGAADDRWVPLTWFVLVLVLLADYHLLGG